MKNLRSQLICISTVALLAIATGCTTTKQTEDMLSASGFKIVPASTPQQQAHLKTLPAHKVTMVQRDGKVYFVYPDVKQNVLYVGQQTQYQQYQKARQEAMLAAEQESAAAMNDEAWSTWGMWGGPGWW
jgi:hypothetical protein